MTQRPATRRRQLATLLACTALVACTTADFSPTAVAPSDAPLAAKPVGGGSVSYTVTDLGTAGHRESVAYDVNDAGIVVGEFHGTTGIHAFARVNGQLVTLSTASNYTAARAVSNGSPTYVVGFVTPTRTSSRPVRWTIDGATISGPDTLEIGRSNIATEVNDDGAAIGTGTIWGPDGKVAAEVDPPEGFTTFELTDINNAGLVTLRAWGGAALDRGFIRFPDGSMVVLAPPVGMEAHASQALEVSEQTGTLVHVGGRLWFDGTFYAARWTFDVAARTVTNVTVRPERSWANGISDGGTLSGGQGTYEAMRPVAWKLDGTAINLPVPKGGKQGYASAMSPNGKLIIGTAQFNSSDAHALLWSGSGP
jgi:uncharacterized membrane protein